MRVLGLSGGIATGKSLVSGSWRDKGVTVIDCDKIARQVLNKDTGTYKRVVAHFGRGILQPDGDIDRAKLSDAVFTDSSKRRKLNQITHPTVFMTILWRLLLCWLAHKSLVVIDMPLLFETGSYRWTWPTVVVTCPETLQIERLMRRDGCTQHQARLKATAQMPMSLKESRATFVINNSGSMQDTVTQAAEVLRRARMGASWRGFLSSPAFAALVLLACKWLLT